MESLLVHLCTIQERSATTNSLGEQTYTWAAASTDVKCRLAPSNTGTTKSGGMLRLESGEFVERAPILILKSTETVTEINRIVGTYGFSDTYEVIKVRNAYDGLSLHHIECDLKKVI